jgi:hypothetical protein
MKTITTFIACLTLVFMSGGSALLHAEVIEIPLASQASEMQNLERPKTGMTTAQVIDQFGEPLTSTAAVGDPPISRWEYTDYYVYFEYSHVIHTVLKHRPTL